MNPGAPEGQAAPDPQNWMFVISFLFSFLFGNTPTSNYIQCGLVTLFSFLNVQAYARKYIENRISVLSVCWVFIPQDFEGSSLIGRLKI